MRKLVFALIVLFSSIGQTSIAQCEADTSIVLTNFQFSTLGTQITGDFTIPLGSTVAFINLQGNHNLDGITDNFNNEPYNNPVDIFLDETVGTQIGTCMGVIEFDVPGIYNFNCGLTNSQAGMNLTIIVDAYDLNDLIVDLYSVEEVPVFLSYFAFSTNTDLLSSEGPWTLFAPNDEAVNEILEYMNLNQFSASAIPDFPEILEYHFAEGFWLEEDLYNGLLLSSAQGQTLSISENNDNLFVNNAQIISTNYTAYNGIIHVIDQCLAPQGLPEATVMQIIRNSEEHQILEQAIDAVSLSEDLSVQATIVNSIDGPGPWTVFAPTDLAFEIFAEEIGLSTTELLNSQFLYNIVNNHILNNEVLSSEMYSGNTVVNLEGNNLEFEFTADSVITVIGNENEVEITVTDCLGL